MNYDLLGGRSAPVGSKEPSERLMPEMTVAAESHDACGEGPLWDDRSRVLYWVDINGQRLHSKAWEADTVDTVDPGVPVSALALTEHGELMAAGSAGIWLLPQQGQPQPIAHSFEGKPLAINDCIADPRGRLLAGSTFFDGSDSYPPGYLYQLDSDGSLHILDDGFQLANGMGFSPDNQTLYVTDSALRRIYSYSYSPETGGATHRKLFLKVPPDEGLPDGLTVDSEGFVWSAQWFGRCVCRYDPDGKLERRLSVPADQPSSVAFAGSDLATLIITSAATPDAEMLAPANYRASSNSGGQLFSVKPGVIGKVEYRVSLDAPILNAGSAK